MQSAYFLSNTQFDGDTYVKTRLSYSEFNNSLFAWDDINYNSQSLAGRFRSYYHDNSAGASVEAGTSFADHSMTRAAVFFRQDRHPRVQRQPPDQPEPGAAYHRALPAQTRSRPGRWRWRTPGMSAGRPTLIAGVSYDRNELKRAEEYGTPTASQGLHCQAGVLHLACTTIRSATATASTGSSRCSGITRRRGRWGLSVSSRSRFPNNFERFSTRFGTNSPNPDLAPEQANHFELNWQASPLQGVQLSASVFYDDVQELIQTVVLTPAAGSVAAVTQSQNVGDGHFTRAEIAGDFRVSSRLHLGANYSYLQSRDQGRAAAGHRSHGCAEPPWLRLRRLAAAAIAHRAAQPRACGQPLVGHQWQQHPRVTSASAAIALTNLQVSWQPAAERRGRARRDQPVRPQLRLAPGFPEPGRSMFTKLRYRF